MKFRFCPKCKGTNIINVAGGKIGLSECVKCKFRSTIFPEVEQEKKEEKIK
jgi:Zn ribbon nucleic-acid-binding protein